MAATTLELKRSCSKCRLLKPKSEFHLRKTGRDAGYYSSKCRECTKEESKGWRAKNPDKVLAQYHENKEKVLAYCKASYKDKRHLHKAWAIKRNYGITVDDVLQMVKKQKGRCALCNKKCKFDVVPQRGKGAKSCRFSVDHCHTTGRVRGLLCTGCNVGIGLFKDSPELLRKVIVYLEESQ